MILKFFECLRKLSCFFQAWKVWENGIFWPWSGKIGEFHDNGQQMICGRGFRQTLAGQIIDTERDRQFFFLI